MGKAVVIAWIFAELAVYAVVLSQFSIAAGLLVGIGSTVLGLLGLRLIGRRLALEGLASLSGSAAVGDFRALPLGLLGALLLLLPGFLSDLAGLVLLVAGLGASVRSPPRAPGSQHIDLDRDEWTRLPDDPRK